MDSEKFDKIVLDLLYDELDELTRASAVRHMEQSGRAKALYSELRATREVGALPLLEPPADLAARILAAEDQERRRRPLHQRLGAVVSIVAGYAMRPQLAMAALLLLMLGSSLFLLRAKPGEAGRVLVTERGVPESDREFIAIPIPRETSSGAEVGVAPAGETTRPARRHEGPRDEAPLRAEPAAPAAGSPAPAPPETFGAYAEEADETASSRGRPLSPPAKTKAALTELLGGDLREDDAIREERKTGGCAGDLERYQAVAEAPPSPEAGQEATWDLARCHEKLGRLDLARRGYRSLLSAPLYAERARDALEALPEPVAAAGRAAPAPSPSAEPGAPDKGSAKAGSGAPGSASQP